MTIEQRSKFDLLTEKSQLIQNYCNRAQDYLALAAQEPDQAKVEQLLSDAEGLIAKCRE